MRALAIPELSIQPEASRFAITVAMLAVVVAESKEDPTLTVSVVEVSMRFGAGVTEAWLRVAVIPPGASDTLKVTGELKLLMDFTGTVAELDPPEATVIGEGEIGPIEKSANPLAPGTKKYVWEHRLLVPPEPVQQSSTWVVMSVALLLFEGVSKSIAKCAGGAPNGFA